MHTPSDQRILARTPFVQVIDDFASADEVEHVLARASNLRRLHEQGIRTKHDATGFSFEMPVEGDTVLEALTARTYAVLAIDNVYGDTLRFRRYGEGEAHPPHLDCFEIDGFHLVMTALLYLNDTEAGGATTFLKAQPKPVSVRPKKGRLVVWTNHTAAGEPDPASFHEGAPVEAGHKSTLTNFIYQPLAVCASHPAFHHDISR